MVFAINTNMSCGMKGGEVPLRMDEILANCFSLDVFSGVETVQWWSPLPPDQPAAIERWSILGFNAWRSHAVIVASLAFIVK